VTTRTLIYCAWLMIMFFAMAGFSRSSLVEAAILGTFWIGFWLNETRVRRPLRSFLRLALGSVLLFLFLVVDGARSAGDIAIAMAFWLGVTGLAVIWTAYYERTEPIV
jgi:hypothetical protein